jgi:hypothetical protein
VSSSAESEDNHQKGVEGDVNKSSIENGNNKPRQERRPDAPPSVIERDLPSLLEPSTSYIPPSTPRPPRPKDIEKAVPPMERRTALFKDYDILFKEYNERINKLLLQYRASAENGLFVNPRLLGKYGDITPEDIYEYLLSAKKMLYEDNFTKCEEYLIRAESNYYRAIYATSRLWRLNNIYGFPLWIYFMFMISSITFFYVFVATSGFFSFGGGGGEPLFLGQFPLLAVQAVIWGMIGGLFQDVWYLWSRVQNRDYRNTWTIQYISAPFIGAILGAIVYIIIIAGLIILDTDTTGTPRDFVVMGLAAFAGYRWDWAIKRFETIGARFQQ